MITGGEPMLFDGVIELANELRQLGHVITIETAGTVFQQLACDLMSISPKLSNSIPDQKLVGDGWLKQHEERRLNPEVLGKLISQYDYQLKFVINPEGDGSEWAEIKDLLALLPSVPCEKLFVMPEGRDRETLLRRAKMLAPECIRRGYSLCMRTQVDLWGDTRGT